MLPCCCAQVSLDRTTGQVVVDDKDEPLEAFLLAMKDRGFHAHLLHSTEAGPHASQVQQESNWQQLPIQIWGFLKQSASCLVLNPWNNS